ncbi:MAG: dockerin type I repeat-containing protein, partial [Oscillospiraceae bacterium]|nr:dockerin type I repeat-containing protein [Oscillospiraceae bacterium]
VNVKDATLIQKAVAKLTTLEGDSFTTADVNADSKVDIADLAHFKQYISHDNVVLG